MPQLNYPTFLKAGFDGQPYDDSDFRDFISLINVNPQAAQVTTITVDTAVNDTEYVVFLNSIEVSFTSDSSATIVEVRDGLIAAINGTVGLSYLDAEVASSTALTVTSRLDGVAFTATSPSANLTLTETTAAASAAPVGFGLSIVRTSDDPDSRVGAQRGRLVAASDYAGAVSELTNTADDTQPYAFTLNYAGAAYDVQFTSDGTATTTEISEGLQTAVDALGLPITTAVATDTLTLTGDAGVDFQITNITAGGAGTLEESSRTEASLPSKLLIAVRSAAVSALAQLQDAVSTGYPGNSTMPGGDVGRYIVPTEESVSVGDPVYLRLSANGSLDVIGGWRASANTGCVRVDTIFDVSWHKGISDSQGVLELR